MIEHTVKRKDVYLETPGGKRQVIAEVIEACSNTSRLEVITDVTVMRSSPPPCPGTLLYSQPVTHTSAGCAEERGNGVMDGGGENKDRSERAGEKRLKVSDLNQHFNKYYS